MLEGCLTAMITPFREGRVDDAAVCRLVARQLEGGISGLVVCGTTGESPTLDREERRGLLRLVVEQVGRVIPVWMGTGSYSTADSIERTEDAAADGADGALVVSPYYNRPGVDGLRAHFLAIADASTIPMMLYDIPSRTGSRLGPELCLELARHERIVAVKDAVGSLNDAMTMIGAGLPVLSGDDIHTLPWMAVGARGVVSVASNVVPAEISALVQEVASGDGKAARRRHFRLLDLTRSLFLESNPGPVKALLSEMGLCTAEVRLPLTQASTATREAVCAAYDRAMEDRAEAAGQ